MTSASPTLRASGLVLVTLLAPACAQSLRPAQSLARGELTERMERGLTLSAEGRVISRSPEFEHLEDYVACVEPARSHAHAAARAGRTGRAFSILGASIGLGALLGFGAVVDRDHAYRYLGAAAGTGVVGLGLSLTGFGRKRRAFGLALDATNEYNDAVGSLGATCLDLRFAPPSGPRSPLPYPTRDAQP